MNTNNIAFICFVLLILGCPIVLAILLGWTSIINVYRREKEDREDRARQEYAALPRQELINGKYRDIE